MQVKHRLRINAIVTAISAITILAVLFMTMHRVLGAVDANKTADAIITTAFERLALRTDYMRTGSERAREQVSAKYAQISDLLKSAAKKFTNPEDKKTVAALIEGNESIGKIFRTVVANRKDAGLKGRSEALPLEVEDRLISQLNMRIYETVLLGGKLQESSNAALVSSLKLAGGGIVFVFLLAGVVTIINSATMGRAIIDRIARLRDGAVLIGEGNLDHRIDVKGDDEFADLSNAFNVMTEKLRRSYNDLEKEIGVRKLAEDALRHSEERYRTLFESMIDGFCVVEVIFDPDDTPIDYRFLECNPAFEGQTGLQNAQGRLMRDLAPTHEAHWFEIYGKIALTGEAVRFVNEARQLNRWYDVSAYRVGRPEDRQVAIIFNDITDRMRAEEKLQKAYGELEERVLERTKELYELKDRLEQSVSDRTAELRAVNETLRASRVAALNLMEDALDARRQAEKVSVELQREINSRKESEELLRIFIEHAPASLAMFDRQMRYLSVSRRWLADYGLGERELRGLSHYEVFPDIPERWKEVHRRALAGEVVMRENDRLDRADGSVQWLRWEVRPWYDATGDVAGIVVFSEDISERKQGEDALKQSNADLAYVNRELESFVYSASHDLRAPLRHIASFADLAVKQHSERLDEKGKSYLIRIRSSAAKMTGIIDDLLRLSRVSRQEIQPVMVDLSKMVFDIIAELREADTGRNVEVIIHEGLIVRADRRLMEVAFSNLVENAWKYTSKTRKAHIEFGATVQNGQTVYYLRDNGAGFDQKLADRMFWPFHRLHTASEFEGTGVGLAIVERVISRHGGKIWAEGEVGNGATVYIKLHSDGK